MTDEERTLAIARLTLETCETFREELLELLHGTPADGALPEEIQHGAIAIGRLAKAVGPRGTAIGTRMFADQDVLTIDMNWCYETIARIELIRKLKRRRTRRK